MNQILVMGRSIGSGPATYIAQKFKPAALILISPFTSIKEVAKSMYGFVGALFVKDRFDNLERMKHLSSPVLLIHGKIDKTVPWEHSEALYGTILHRKFSHRLDACNSYCHLVLPPSMNHCEIHYENHILKPIEAFLEKIKFVSEQSIPI